MRVSGTSCRRAVLLIPRKSKRVDRCRSSNYPYIDKQQKLAISLKGSSLKARNGDARLRACGSVRMKETPSFEDTPLSRWF